MATLAGAVLALGIQDDRRLAVLVDGQGDLQGKHRATAFFALRAQGAAHAFGQGTGDGQPKTGAAVTS